MSLKLVNIQPLEPQGLRISYDLQHWTQGAEGTCLSEPVELLVYPNQTMVNLTIKDCDAPTPAEALVRLSSWLRRLADGIDQHENSVKFPL